MANHLISSLKLFSRLISKFDENPEKIDPFQAILNRFNIEKEIII